MSSTFAIPASRAASTLQETLFVSGSDLFALGHYPGNPVYPGALMLERMLAMAGALVSGTLGQPARATAVKRVQYLGVVVPGDVVTLEACVLEQSANKVTCQAVASVGGDARVRATIECGLDSGIAPSPVLSNPTTAVKETNAPALAHQEIARLLPHRYPFVLLDTVQTYSPGAHMLATKVINRESPILGRNPPDTYPAALAIESFGQAGVALYFLSQTDNAPAHALVGAMRDVTLLREIPYDTILTLDVRIERMMANAVVFGGDLRIGDEAVIRIGSLVVMIAPMQAGS
ncbi:3-hydroxymyristoyl/3-hydroxydecanoyl-(acyl carrier protein) dehydratase [Cupriavidus sp. YR651]|uniref:3-hydroxyacyl-ACP dehydratase FabZ family protein n=1 Tax=Cupriavidus sp. YR651 TaxID=1855315 RepID=UPI000888EEB1|nr:beta-hydroxyacyl-ACP dehydratase [Cupriavidus sp. YR651]SDD98539.1 3-hydroxymyristoyl/3-hydroxydecanoyl-(acyl carrier protein) dehydratase [Cupriavidus sp. YR651]